MGLFDKIKEPVFLKESSSAEKQLEALKTLQQQACGELLKKIESEIKIVEAGIFGEKQIMFELKNSHMPMVVLHDLYFEKDGCTAQIDYLIVTRKRQFVLECKNLIGNIEIDSGGNFTRTLPYGRGFRREAFYSPITQNIHHLELIKKIRMESKKNFLARSMFEKSFSENYRSVVVLANPRAILNAKYAKKEIKSQVIRADQLITYIKEVNAEENAAVISEKEMMNLAQFFLDCSSENPTDYLTKYREQIEEENSLNEDILESDGTAGSVQEQNEEAKTVQEQENARILCPKCGAVMIKRMASRGANAGKEFYGCPNFPKCRGIVDIGEKH